MQDTSVFFFCEIVIVIIIITIITSSSSSSSSSLTIGLLSVETAEVICLSSFLAHIAHSMSWFLL